MIRGLFAVILLIASTSSESVHWQWRHMKCVTKEGEKSQKAASPCEMSMGETEFDEKLRTAPFDPCFEEVVDGKPRSYCNVLCPGADTVYLIKRSPPNQRSCFAHFTYKIEKRGTDFYMWRDGKCRSSSVDFLIRCEFAFSRAEFPADNIVFANARRKNF
uniref:Secreted protein n=1 Tax=Haemonchus contortus TaxID=6289 RepID=A0A7I4YS76_HAECO